MYIYAYMFICTVYIYLCFVEGGLHPVRIGGMRNNIAAEDVVNVTVMNLNLRCKGCILPGI